VSNLEALRKIGRERAEAVKIAFMVEKKGEWA